MSKDFEEIETGMTDDESAKPNVPESEPTEQNAPESEAKPENSPEGKEQKGGDKDRDLVGEFCIIVESAEDDNESIVGEICKITSKVGTLYELRLLRDNTEYEAYKDEFAVAGDQVDFLKMPMSGSKKEELRGRIVQVSEYSCVIEVVGHIYSPISPADVLRLVKEEKSIVGQFCVVFGLYLDDGENATGKILREDGTMYVVFLDSTKEELTFRRAQFVTIGDCVDFKWEENLHSGVIDAIIPKADSFEVEKSNLYYNVRSIIDRSDKCKEDKPKEDLLGMACIIVGDNYKGRCGYIGEKAGASYSIEIANSGGVKTALSIGEFVFKGDRVKYSSSGLILIGRIVSIDSMVGICTILDELTGKEYEISAIEVLDRVETDTDDELIGKECVIVQKQHKGKIGKVTQSLPKEKYEIVVHQSDKYALARKEFVVVGDIIKYKDIDGSEKTGQLKLIDKYTSSVEIGEFSDKLSANRIIGHADESQEPAKPKEGKIKFDSKTVELIDFLIEQALLGINIKAGDWYKYTLRDCFVVVAFSKKQARIEWREAEDLLWTISANNHIVFNMESAEDKAVLEFIQEADNILFDAITDLLPYLESNLESPTFLYDALLILMNGQTSIAIENTKKEEVIFYGALINDLKFRIITSTGSNIYIFDTIHLLNSDEFEDNKDNINSVASAISMAISLNWRIDRDVTGIDNMLGGIYQDIVQFNETI